MSSAGQAEASPQADTIERLIIVEQELELFVQEPLFIELFALEQLLIELWQQLVKLIEELELLRRVVLERLELLRRIIVGRLELLGRQLLVAQRTV